VHDNFFEEDNGQLALFDADEYKEQVGFEWVDEDIPAPVPAPRKKYVAAFHVFLREDGEYVVDNTLEPFDVERYATLREISRGLSETLEAVKYQMQAASTIEAESTADRLRKALLARG